MIKLTIRSKSASITRIFQGLPIRIGSKGHLESDLVLSDEKLQDTHVQIVFQNGLPMVINCANDPFVSLNGRPFGKKALKNHDILRIGSLSITFEQLADIKESSLKTHSVSADSQINEEIENLLQQVEILKTKHLHQELPALTQSPSILDETLLKQESTEPAQSVIKTPEEANSTPELMVQNNQKAAQELQSCIFDDPFFDSSDSSFDEESEGLDGQAEEAEKLAEANHGNWSFIFKAVLMTAVFLFMTSLMGFLNLREKTRDDRLKASEGVADVAMALTYAQAYHIKPERQNWFDPEFLKNNLAAVISSDSLSFTHMDSHGQFSNCPYILRIYTSSDLSRFLIIAQPDASFFQWLIPQHTIVLDSETMELRLIDDLKILNRVLVNQAVLDTAHASEISHAVARGELVPLSLLSQQKNDRGFAPPKVLALVRPGSENKVYNAPRYYQFGEHLLNRAMGLLQIGGNSYELARLQDEVEELSKFSNMILYSSQNIQKALLAQKALATFAPTHQFLTACIHFDQKGKIQNSHLLLSGDYTSFFPTSEFFPKPALVSTQRSRMAESEIAAVESTSKHGTDSHSLNLHHPLYLRLLALEAKRINTLRPLSFQLIHLLKSNLDHADPDFVTHFEHLWKKYRGAYEEQHALITDELRELYQEYVDVMPLAEFENYIKASHLDSIAEAIIKNQANGNATNSEFLEQIQRHLDATQEASDFESLDYQVSESRNLLHLKNLSDPQALIHFQAELREKTLQKLRNFILSPNLQLPAAVFTDENRGVLSRILAEVWVTDPEEYHFYLSEYDMRREPSKDKELSESK